jgi:hypothetical protein
MTTPLNFTTPVGRLVQGSLYKPNDKDAEGRPLVIKNGSQAGQARVEYYVALAVPKERDPAGQIKHWAATEWGAKIWQAGHAGMAQAGAMPTFAWKVRDGDSQVPNRKGKKPVDQEGFAGCWVISFSSGFPPRVYNRDGTQPITEAEAVKLGYYAQINANVDFNGSGQQPGVFINLSMVALAGYGPEIFVGPDPSAAGFGAAPLPAGASVTPLGGMPAAMPAAPGMPAVPAMPGMPAPGAPVMPAVPPMPGAVMPGMPAAPGMPAPAVPAITPNPAILQPPALPPVPAAPGQVPLQRARVMLPAARGATYEQLIANGWNDQLLVQHGMMQP